MVGVIASTLAECGWSLNRPVSPTSAPGRIKATRKAPGAAPWT